MSALSQSAYEGGFTEAARQAAASFRTVMDVAARPGKIVTLDGAFAPEPLSIAGATLLLTLCDADTPVYVGESHRNADLLGWLTFQTGAPVVDHVGEAQFAVGTFKSLQPFEGFADGSDEYPDRSTTLIVDGLAMEHDGSTLTGPGVKDSILLSLPNPEIFADNAKRYPRGLDFFFTWDDQICALPRSTRVATNVDIC